MCKNIPGEKTIHGRRNSHLQHSNGKLHAVRFVATKEGKYSGKEQMRRFLNPKFSRNVYVSFVQY